MSAAETASPSPAAVPADGAGVASKPSTSTWTPNADAAEWTPSFALAAAPEGGKGVAGAASPAALVGSVEVSTESAGVSESKSGGGQEAEGDGPLEDDAKPAVNGDVAATKIEGAPAVTGAAGGKEEKIDAAEGLRTFVRYEIDFLLKLRPPPESTPKPAGLNPPERVDILWDGKLRESPSAKVSGPIRSGIRPLLPLSRMGSARQKLGGDTRAPPPPLKKAQSDRYPSHSGGRGSGRDERPAGGGGGGRRPYIDTAPPLEDCKPIEINEATRWKPKSLEVKSNSKEGEKELSVEEVLSKAIAILNKMTLEKFGKLSVAFMEVGCRDPVVVSGVIDMIVDKAQMEHHFSSMYADLCERIARTPIAGLGEDASGKDAAKGSKKFRKMLLLKCQEEFVKDWQGLFAAVQNDPNLAEDLKKEKEFLLKRKYMGHMRFVGELYKVELLKERHVIEAIRDMFGNADEPDEERLECMVKLMQTCGSKLDSTGSSDTAKDIKRLFKRIGKLAETRHISSRIRFMLRDLIELRKNRWVPRRAEEKAKTMQELHNDIAKEEESKNRSSGRGGGSSSRSGGGTGSSSSGSLRPGSGDARVSGSARLDSTSLSSRPTGQTAPKAKDDEGWEVVPKKGGGKIGGGGAGGGDGWSQVSSSRSRTSNLGSDERRGGSGGGGGGGGMMSQQSGFALLGSHDDEKEKKKKKKDSKDKKDKSGKKKDRSSKPSTSSTNAKGSGGSKSSSPVPVSSAGSVDGKAFPGSREGSNASMAIGKPPVPPPTMTEDTARKKGKDVVAEYAVSGELEEACTCLSEIDASVRWAAVSEAISDAMERKQKHRDALAVVLNTGAKNGALTRETLMKGINDVLELVPDLSIDVPQVTTYVASAVVPLVLEGYLPLGCLVTSPCESLLEGGKAAEFSVAVLSELKAAAVAEGMSEEEATRRVSEEASGAGLSVTKLASMLPVICKGDEGKAMALLERKGVSIS